MQHLPSVLCTRASCPRLMLQVSIVDPKVNVKNYYNTNQVDSTFFKPLKINNVFSDFWNFFRTYYWKNSAICPEISVHIVPIPRPSIRTEKSGCLCQNFVTRSQGLIKWAWKIVHFYCYGCNFWNNTGIISLNALVRFIRVVL